VELIRSHRQASGLQTYKRDRQTPFRWTQRQHGVNLSNYKNRRRMRFRSPKFVRCHTTRGVDVPDYLRCVFPGKKQVEQCLSDLDHGREVLASVEKRSPAFKIEVGDFLLRYCEQAELTEKQKDVASQLVSEW